MARRPKIARRKPVKPRRKPLAADTVVAALAQLARAGSWFFSVATIAERCDASPEQVKDRLRALARQRVVESADVYPGSRGRPSLTWRLKRS